MDKNSKVKFGPFETTYEGRIFKIKKREVLFPDGAKQTHEYCQRFNSITVLPFDDKGRLLLTRETRIGEKISEEWFLTCGRIDKGETARQAAQRELREEIGYKAKTLKLINKKSSGSEYFIWDIYLFVARDLVKESLNSGDEHFSIEVVPTPLNKAVKMAMNGTIKNENIAFHIIRFDYMIKHGQFKW